ncbi:MAG: tetratricopeptide repeat protein [Deltaproteobacteria bacterium]|nr:tetratricopeptide repeat protein [Deltaproteobacteria bacterium]
MTTERNEGGTGATPDANLLDENQIEEADRPEEAATLREIGTADGPITGPLMPSQSSVIEPTNRTPITEFSDHEVEFLEEDDLTLSDVGREQLSEGEEAISDTFRASPQSPAGHDLLPELRGQFIGRTELLAQLKECFLQVRRNGELCFLTLLGEPGVGKSRVTREFARAVRGAIPDARVLSGAAAPTARRSYEAVARALSERFGISREETPEEIRHKIQQAVAEALPESSHVDVPPLIAHLMQIPFPDSPVLESLAQAGQLELRAYIALRRFIMRDTERGPLLLCFDGMENATNETVNLIHYLADGLKGRPVMVLSTARDDIFRRHTNWGQGDFATRRLDVAPMPNLEAEALLVDLFHDALIPDEMLEVAREHLGGIPRSIHELTRFSLETGILVPRGSTWFVDKERLKEVSLPRTHVDILRARLHSLPPTEQGLLQQAAVVGEVFWLDAVVALHRSASITSNDPDGPTLEQIAAVGESMRAKVAEGIKALCERGLITECSDSTIAGEREFRFAPPPTFELTHEMLDDSVRHRFHQLAAQWLEARPEGRDEVRQEQVGHHFERAGDLRSAATRFRRAADAARSRYFVHKAIRLYRRALTCLGDFDLITRLHLWHDLGSVLQHKGDFDGALDAYERMVRLGWVVASRPKAAVAFNKMGRVWRQKGNLNLAAEYLQRGLDMFRQANDERGVATSLDDLGQIHWLLGHYDEALDHSANALEMRRQMGNQRSIALSLSNIGNIEKDRGLFNEAESCYREALRLRQAVGDAHGYVISLNNLAALDCERGNLDHAQESWKNALAEAERIGAVPLQMVILNNLGELSTRNNKPAEARQRLQRAMSLATEIDDPRTYIDVLRNLALVELQEGNSEKAQKYGEQCIRLARDARLPEMVGKAHLALAEVHAQTLFDASASHEQSTARDYFRKAIGVFRQMGNEGELAKALRLFGEYLIEQASTQQGIKTLREAQGLFSKLGMREAKTLDRVLADLENTGPSKR